MKRIIIISLVTLVTLCSVAWTDLGEELIQAAGDDNLAEVVRLIEAGADLDFQDYFGSTALMRAALYGHTEMVEFLIDAGANVNIQAEFGGTALINAASQKYANINLSVEQRKKYAEILKKHMKEQQSYLNENISIPQLSKELNIPHYYLSMTINIEFNTNYYGYINSLRIKHAEELLRDPKENNESILMIAYRAGFQSKTTFNRVFKTIHHKTPKEYRDKFKMNN